MPRLAMPGYCRLVLGPDPPSAAALDLILGAHAKLLDWLDLAVPPEHSADLVALHRNYYDAARTTSGLPARWMRAATISPKPELHARSISRRRSACSIVYSARPPSKLRSSARPSTQSRRAVGKRSRRARSTGSRNRKGLRRLRRLPVERVAR